MFGKEKKKEPLERKVVFETILGRKRTAKERDDVLFWIVMAIVNITQKLEDIQAQLDKMNEPKTRKTTKKAVKKKGN